MRSKLAPVMFAAAALLLMTSCSTSTTEGGASASVEAEALDLDTGDFPTTPSPAFTTVANETSGRIVEGQRMAEYVVLPTELDPLLTKSEARETVVLKSASAVDLISYGGASKIAERDGMVTGFSTARSYEDQGVSNSVIHAVLRFPDADTARRAARDMSDASLQPDDVVTPSVPAPIAILPETHVTSHEYLDDFSAEAFTARGDHVIYTYAGASLADQDWVAQMIAKAVELQGPMIDQFPATSAAELATVPMDIDNLLVYAIPGTNESRRTDEQGVYGPRGAAHFSADPQLALSYFSKTGVRLVARDGSHVYRADDEAGAKRLFELFAAEMVNLNDFTEVEPPANVAGAKCFARDTGGGEATYCIVQNGRHLGEVTTFDDPLAARQMAAAQYLILEGAQ